MATITAPTSRRIFSHVFILREPRAHRNDAEHVKSTVWREMTWSFPALRVFVRPWFHPKPSPSPAPSSRTPPAASSSPSDLPTNTSPSNGNSPAARSSPVNLPPTRCCANSTKNLAARPKSSAPFRRFGTTTPHSPSKCFPSFAASPRRAQRPEPWNMPHSAGCSPTSSPRSTWPPPIFRYWPVTRRSPSACWRSPLRRIFRRSPIADPRSAVAASASEWAFVGIRRLAGARRYAGSATAYKDTPYSNMERSQRSCASLRGHASVVTIYAVPCFVLPPRGGVAFRLGGVAWRGQPCQQQPSTKTVRRCAPSTKSGFTRKAFTFSPATFHWSEAPRRQPVMPWARKTVMSRRSVAALPRERMADIAAERFRLVKMSATD